MSTILAFGDSNTWGLIPGSKPHKRYPREVRWTGVLESLKPDVRIIEEGLCGRTTVYEDPLRPGRRGLSSLPGILESQYPLDGAIVMLGTNDCKTIYGISAYTIGRGLELNLDILARYVAPSKTLIVSPLYIGEEVWRPEKDPEFDKHSIEVSKELKNVYRGIAAERGMGFLAASDIASPSSIDDEHFDEEGHKLFAQAVLVKLNEMYTSLDNWVTY